ncbi:MAG: S-4TM family putative pore-forming effector [Candidatus Sedimenticola sp. 6PFRAG5]
MDSISTLQNKEENIQKLAAAREAYSRSKAVLQINFWLSVIGAILVSAISILLKSQAFATKIGIQPLDISFYASLYGVAVTVIDVFFLSKFIKTYRELGALIQESFDTNVYSMPWNQVLVGEKTAPEDIYGLYEKHAKKADLSKLKDWYPVNDSNLSGDPVSINVCQRTNLMWDMSLRKKALLLSKLFLLVVVAAIIWLGVHFNVSLTQFLVGFVVPMLPLFVFVSKSVRSNTESISYINSIKSHVESLMEKIQRGELDHQSALLIARQLQDAIFTHRNTTRPVSDWLYWKTKDNQEKRAKYAASSWG